MTLRLSLSLALLLSALPVLAQTLDPTFATTSAYAPAGLYSAQVQTDGRRIICGTFSRINGTAVAAVARFEANGALDQSFAQNVGAARYVVKVRALTNGQYLLQAANDTVRAGGLSRHQLLRLNANGTADAGFSLGAGVTYLGQVTYLDDAQELPGGKVLVTGYFDAINGTSAPYVARLNADGSVDNSFAIGSGATDEVFSATVQPDGKILLCGYFGAFNGRICPGLVRLNPDGSLDSSFSAGLQAGSQVHHATVQPDGKVLVDGFLGINNGTRGLARLNPNGTLDNSFAAAGLPARSLSQYYLEKTVQVQPDGKILVGGSFTLAGGGPGNGLCRLNADGTTDPTFQLTPGPNVRPSSLTLQPNGTVLVAGAFYQIGSRDDAPLVQLTSAGALDASFAPTVQVPANISQVVPQADGRLLVYGNFTELNGQRTYRVARLSAEGVPETSFTANVGPVTTPMSGVLVQPDGNILLATQTQVRRVLPSGLSDNSFAPAVLTGGSLLARPVLQPDGKILLAGSFTALNGQTVLGGIARLNANGSLDASFVAQAHPVGGVMQLVFALQLQANGSVVAGGSYGNGGMYLVRFLPNGTLDTGFPRVAATYPGNSPVFYAITPQPDGKLLIGGNFTSLGGVSRTGIGRLNVDGSPDATFNPASVLSGSVNRIELQPNGRILVGGTFQSTALPGYRNLLRLLADGQPDASFANTANPSGTVRGFVVQPDGKLLISGSFTAVGARSTMALARLTAPNVLTVRNSALKARTQVWPVPAHANLHLALDATARPQVVQLLDPLGRVVLTQAATPEMTLPVQHLAPGVYLLRVQYAAGTVTRRVVVE